MRSQMQLDVTSSLELKRHEQTLHNMLPTFVVDGLLSGQPYGSFTKALPCVSVVFCKIVDFDSWVSVVDPSELVSVLNRMFGTFDQSCGHRNVMKIETVSEVYFACSGIDPEGDQDPDTSGAAVAAVQVAVDMLYFASRVTITLNERAKNKMQLDGDRRSMSIKVGINSGRVICGVVGARKPQFSLYGDTVNTASRMAAFCPRPNAVQISQETRALLQDSPQDGQFEWRPHKAHFKGKGELQTFVLAPSENDAERSKRRTKTAQPSDKPPAINLVRRGSNSKSLGNIEKATADAETLQQEIETKTENDTNQGEADLPGAIPTLQENTSRMNKSKKSVVVVSPPTDRRPSLGQGLQTARRKSLGQNRKQSLVAPDGIFGSGNDVSVRRPSFMKGDDRPKDIASLAERRSSKSVLTSLPFLENNKTFGAFLDMSNTKSFAANVMEEGSGVRLFLESINDRIEQLSWLLRFPAQNTEADYRRENMIKNSQSVAVQCARVVVAVVLFVLVLLRLQHADCCHLWFVKLRMVWSFVVCFVIAGILAGSSVPLFRKRRHLRLQAESQVLSLVFGVGALFAIMEPVVMLANDGVASAAVTWTIPTFEFLIFTTALSSIAGLLFATISAGNVFFLFISLASVLVVAESHHGDEMAYLCCVIWGWLILLTLAAYQAEVWDRCTFLAGLQAAHVGQRASKLLEEMLPEQIRLRLQVITFLKVESCIILILNFHVRDVLREDQGNKSMAAPGKIADEYSSMVLLFSDVCGFTAFSKTVPAETVVRLVKKIIYDLKNCCWFCQEMAKPEKPTVCMTC